MKKFSFPKLTPIALTICASQLMTAQSGNAQELVLEEVLVTATKREASLSEVPQSISAYSVTELEDIGAQDFSGLVEAVPGVELRSSQAGSGSIAVRGISEQKVVSGGSGAAAGFYLDEVPLTVAGNLADVKSFDVARIEVLRGPQGTLYGEGSMTGAIRLVTEKPSTEAFAGKLDMTYADIKDGSEDQIVNVMLNIPVTDNFAIRAVGFYNEAGGFIDQVDWNTGVPVGNDANDAETTGGRISARWEATDKLTISALYMNSDADRGALSMANDDLMQAVSVDTSMDDELDIYNLTIEYGFSWADLVASSSWFKRDTLRISDLGGLIPAIDQIFAPAGFGPFNSAFTDEAINAEAFTQEIRLVSNGEGPWQWTAGVFYKDHEHQFAFNGLSDPVVPGAAVTPTAAFFQMLFLEGCVLGVPVSPPGCSADQMSRIVPISDLYTFDTQGTIEQMAVFGEVSYDINEQWQILLGARVFSEERDSFHDDGGLFPLLLAQNLPARYVTKGDEDVVSPKLTLKYQANDDLMFYGTYSEGFRSGGQNDFFSILPGAVESYDSETLTNYEFGVKNQLLGGRVAISAAVYYMEWEDIQLNVIEGPGGLSEAADNAGDASSTGIDFEMQALLAEGLDLSIGATLVEAETEDNLELPTALGAPGIPVPAGTRLPGVAEKSFNAALNYRFPLSDALTGMARLSYSYTDGALSTLSSSLVSPSYSIVNLRVGVESENWQLALFSNNLLDEEIVYHASVFQSPWVGAENTVGRPRTVGLNVRFSF